MFLILSYQNEEILKKIKDFDENSAKDILDNCLKIHCDLSGKNEKDDMRTVIYNIFNEFMQHKASNIYLKAKYWKAYCLLEGYGIEKDKIEAQKLFKEVADAEENKNPCKHDAELRYAFTLYNKGEKINEELLKYLELAAEGGNATANYNLGELYYKGELVPEDKMKGRNHFAYAAQKGHPKAMEMCQTLGID
ncbi:19466_t:CDS:1 [Gigaspora margarita]|uniref:19466_t:CDS:1 n=1 Tax=Gigaspora margarita TaxID=4874 RepID=A0ABN7V4Z9_GIGMA|nr:19466_t:CDS:1 [Gigaspora margarita]